MNGFIVDDGLDVLGHMIVVKVGGLAASRPPSDSRFMVDSCGIGLSTNLYHQ